MRIHTGLTIKDEIEHRNISVSEFSKLMGLSEDLINKILEGSAPVTEGIAIKLEEVLDIPVSLWLKLEEMKDE